MKRRWYEIRFRLYRAIRALADAVDPLPNPIDIQVGMPQEKRNRIIRRIQFELKARGIQGLYER